MSNKNPQADRSGTFFSRAVDFKSLFLLGFGFLALVFVQGAGAATVTLQWDPVVGDPLVTGYDVHYGLESGQYLWVKDADIDGAATDTQIVDNLTAGDTYCFVVRSHNDDRTLFSAFSNEVCALVESSNTTTSDTVPPTVSISTTPTGPTYTSAQTVTISAAASDDVGVTRVEFYDGAVLKGTDTSAPYSYGWAISSADNGSHSWTAKAYDAAGNVATSAALIRTVDIVNDSLTELVPAQDTLVELPLDEGSGAIAFDVSGAGNDGILQNGAAFEADTPDGSAYAVRLDGVDDFLELGPVDVDGSGLTLAAWFNADSFPGRASDPRLISKASGTADDDHVFMLSTIRVGAATRLRARVRVEGVTTTLIAGAGDLLPGVWQHAAVTYDGSTLRLYLDGQEVGSTPLSGAVDTDPGMPVAVGSQPPGAGDRYGDRVFDGLLDDVRILQRGLSAAEIEGIISGQPGAPEAVDDSYGVSENATLVVDAATGVLSNDTDPDLDGLQAVLVSDVANGVLTLYADGSFDYTPAADYSGTDSFTYRASDGFLESNLATVTLTVNEVNDAPVAQDDALVELPLDEGSGTVAFDVSGAGNDGILQNGAAFEADTPDGSAFAVRLDGVDDFLELGPVDVDGSGLTLAAWFNADSFPGRASDPRLISKASGTADDDHVFMLSTIRVGVATRLRARVRVEGVTTTLIASKGDVLPGVWRHAAVTYDGSTLRLYLDGQEVGSTPLSGAVDLDPWMPVAVGSQPPGAGDRYGDRVFDGLLDDVRILQRGLSAEEIGAIVSGAN